MSSSPFTYNKTATYSTICKISFLNENCIKTLNWNFSELRIYIFLQYSQFIAKDGENFNLISKIFAHNVN